MKFELIAQMVNGARETLDQAEFVGEWIETLSDAIDAAKDALEYINGDGLQAEYIDIYCDENRGTSNGYCGYVDADGWHRDCDCDLG